MSFIDIVKAAHADPFADTWYRRMLKWTSLSSLLIFSPHLLQVNWGSSSQAFTFIQALRYTRRLDGIDDHVKNFRPHCLVLTGPPQDRPNLTHLASQITKNVSLMVYGNVIKKEFGALPSNTADTLWIRENKIKAFQAVTTGMNACIFFPLLRQYEMRTNHLRQSRTSRYPPVIGLY